MRRNLNASQKEKLFAEKHPFITLATFPVSIPIMAVAETAKKSNKANKKRTYKRSYYIPNEVSHMDGYQFEQYVAMRLRAVGYTNVDVTPKSGDYGADIIAYSPPSFNSIGKRVCFQCKKYSKPVGVKAVQEIIGAMVYYKCHVGCVVSTAGFTESARNLAASAGVVLMDVNSIRRV